MMLNYALILMLACFAPAVPAARILGVFPHIGKSHFFVFEPLMKALSARGHDVHVISQFPQSTPIPNYTDISLKRSQVASRPTGGVTLDSIAGESYWQSFFTISRIATDTCESVLSFSPIRSLLQSNETFEVVFTELFNTDCFLGFVHKFNAPHIALSSCALMPWASDRFGNPDNPSYIPLIFRPHSDHMSFGERLTNTLQYMFTKFMYSFVYSRPAQTIGSKYFDNNQMPSIDEIAWNTSLILVNSHPTVNGPRPMVPAVVEVAGIHLQTPRKLPEELDRWLNESRDGVIYFSMGSMLRADSVPADKRAALLEAFAELPQRVLWKWGADSLPGQPDNVRVAKWLPQRDILNHPKIRVFMTHCGMLGVVEAVSSGVPMVGTPIFGDQHSNCKAIEQRGVAVIVEYDRITKESILNALRKVLYDTSFTDNAKLLSKRFLDRPHSPMETAIFWTEYVIRHQGAHHLRSAAVELNWFQYVLLDVVLVIFATTVLALFAFNEIVHKTRHMFHALYRREEKQKLKLH